VFPIIQADYSYYDDAARTLLLGENLWRSQGRLFMELAQTVASFNTVSVDVFPLPLLLVLPVLVAALVSLCRHYFPQPCLLDTQVVMPLLYTPFILGILNYQYDGPMVLLGVCCVVFAITVADARRGVRLCVASLLIAVAAGLYQTTVQIFVCLCCIDCLRAVHDGATFRATVRALAERAVQLTFGLLLYGVTAFQFYTSLRGEVARTDEGWGALLQWRAEKIVSVFGTFVNDGNRWLFIVTGVLVLAGFVQLLWSIRSAGHPRGEQWALGLLCFVALFTITIVVPGPLLFIADFALGPRTLIAFACVTVLAFYLIRNVLKAAHPLLSGLLIIPLFGMLSFSYAYGRVLVAQKAFETSVVYSISHDLASDPRLRQVKDFYLLPSRPYELWVPGSTAAVMETMPAIKFMLTVPQITTPERFAAAGITHVMAGYWSDYRAAAARQGDPQRVMSTLFYDITLMGDVGYIQMNAPLGSGRYRYHW
jgi:hypothetical protein